MKIAASPLRVFCALLAFFAAAVAPHVLRAQSTPVPPNEGFVTVAQIMRESCLGCHEWADSYKGIADPARIVAGFPAKSILFMRVAKDEMPPSEAKMGRDAKLILRAWIAEGAPSTAAAVGRKDSGKPPYPAAANVPATPIPEPCPCGLD
jgi:hypothetical protein